MLWMTYNQKVYLILFTLTTSFWVGIGYLIFA